MLASVENALVMEVNRLMMLTIKQGTEQATSKMERRDMARIKKNWLTSRYVL